MKCSVAECLNEAWARSWCRKHYERWRSHGNVETVIKAMPPVGAVGGYFAYAVSYNGDDCLIWAYSDNGAGYGMMQRNGRRTLVHRAVCEEVNGPPPTSEHHAAHSCGNGHLGCITPKHLRWAAPVENHADMVKHGTESRGEAHPISKLTEMQVLEIFRRASAGEVQNKIAADFNIAQTLVSLIKRGKRWAWLTGVSA